MKRILALAAAIAVTLAACSSQPTLPDLPTPTPTPPPKPPPVDYSDYEIISHIDGSTATIPLSEAVLLNRFGTFQGLEHNRTHEAYVNLIEGERDIIFVTYPSEDELRLAENRGVELEIIPVVKDALVFLCNTANPVQTLTQRQIKDIYTGKITGWSAVGGKNAPITAFQRPENSGSQTLFLKLAMEDEAPSDPPLTLRPSMMGDLVDAVADYNNAENTLGYSVFYYVSDMYGSPDVRLMAVDGVIPTRDTIAADIYPYITYYYAVMRKATPADHPARALLNWLLTDDGQYVARDAGYVPLRPLSPRLSAEGFGYYGSTPENTTLSSGTGGTEYRLNEVDIFEWRLNGVFDWGNELTDYGFSDFPELKRAINGWLDNVNRAAGTDGPHWQINGYTPVGNLLNVSLVLQNSYQTLCAVFDMTTQKQLGLSDLFYDGVNYIEYINSCIGTGHGSFNSFFISDMPEDSYIKRAFTGLPNDYPHFEVTYSGGRPEVRLIFDDDNPFFQAYAGFSFNVPLPLDLSPWGLLYSLEYDRVDIDGQLVILIPRVQTKTAPSDTDGAINQALRELAAFGSENSELDRSWFAEGRKYNYYPSVSFWDTNMSVMYSSTNIHADLMMYGAWFAAMFDLTSGEPVDAARYIPEDWRERVEYGIRADGTFFEIKPAENAELTDIFINSHNIYATITGADGEKYRVIIWRW